MLVISNRWISIAGVFLFLLAVFCGGFLFFRNRTQHSPPVAPEQSGSLIDKPFPHAQLLDIYGSKVDEQVIRTGRVVVVFVTPDCDACAAEGKFLQTLLGRRRDVTFYGLLPFGKPSQSPNEIEKTFPFRVFYDENNSFVTTMGINRVPVKVFLEDGIIKKGWIGASALTDNARASFTAWLDSLP